MVGFLTGAYIIGTCACVHYIIWGVGYGLLRMGWVPRVSTARVLPPCVCAFSSNFRGGTLKRGACVDGKGVVRLGHRVVWNAGKIIVLEITAELDPPH